jgi:hypothetical protein
MRRSLICALALAGVLAMAAPASGEIIEIGRVEPPATPSCPSNPCLAVSRTTGFQVKVGDTGNLTVAPKAGRLVAFTVTLARPDDNQINFFNTNLGGEPQARVSVLKPSRDRKRYKLVGQGEIVTLTPYLGMTAQFPLLETLRVNQGDVIALTVPTWAPTLAVGLDRKDAWRSSRSENACDDTRGQSAMAELGGKAPFACLYRTARLAYSATLIATP